VSPVRPADFEPLASADPVPGDAEAVAALGRRYRDTASEIARQVTALAAAKAAGAPGPVRDRVRRRLIRVLRDTLRQATAAGGVDVLVSLAERRGYRSRPPAW
jgi:hypothetical protein